MIYRDSSNRLTYQKPESLNESYSKLVDKVVEHFCLDESSTILPWHDVIYHDWHLGDAIIGLEWHPYEGFVVSAKNELAEKLVQGIAEFLDR